MRISKRDFVAGASFLGVASLVGAVSSQAAEQREGRTTSVFKEMTADLGEHGSEYVFTNNVGSALNA